MSKQRVLLIRPNQIHWKNEAKRVGTPLGLLSIAATLIKEGHEVSFIDSCVEGYETEREIKPGVWEYGLSEEEIKGKVREFKPDFVGIQSLLTCYSAQALETARIIKEVNPQTRTVLGGQHISMTSHLHHEEKTIDYIVCGEGERAVLEILRELPDKKVVNGEQGDLETFDIPAFQLLSDSYPLTDEMSFFGKLRGDNFVLGSMSRGCPQNCNYCTISDFSGRKIRHYSLGQVEKQIATLKEMGFTDYVSVDDNVLMFPREFRKGYFRLLRESGMNWYLDGGLYYALVEEKSLEEIEGCSRVFLPVENHSLSRMHSQGKYKMLKDQSAAERKIREVAGLLNGENIKFYSAVMIGFPGETWAEIQRTLNFAEQVKEMGAEGVGFHWVHPYPGTTFYDRNYHQIPEERKLETNPEYYTFIKPVFPIKGISIDEAEEEVNQRFRRINQTFILNNSADYGKIERLVK